MYAASRAALYAPSVDRARGRTQYARVAIARARLSALFRPSPPAASLPRSAPLRFALLPLLPLAALSASPASLAETLTAADVDTVVRQAGEAIADSTQVIAVSDRPGNVLAVWEKGAAAATDRELAISLARTGAFFSSNQAPLSSRTVRFLSGVHFPPGVRNTPAAALYGIENTNRGCPLNVSYSAGQAFPPARSLDGTTTGLGVTTGKADSRDSDPSAVNGGGVPLFKNGELVGGIGVAGVKPGRAEFAAFRGAAGFLPSAPPPGAIFLEGIRLPFVKTRRRPAGASAGSFTGAYVAGPADGMPAPEGYLVLASASAELAASDVSGIIDRCIARAKRTRAAIRLPLGSRTRMVIAVGDLAGNILGLYRMVDSTVFSVDVSVAKARNAVYFSGLSRAPADLPGVPRGTAVTNRTIGFGAQPFFPSGIDGTSPGPFFDLFERDSSNPCTQGAQPAGLNQNGIVFFPGALPLYRGGSLVGGLGVSGDGVEQDDYVTAAGAEGFEAPEAIRAGRILIRNVRLPYLKFPRNPEE